LEGTVDKPIDWQARALTAERQLARLSSKRVKGIGKHVYQPNDEHSIDEGIEKLKAALGYFSDAGAVCTVHRVRLALSSAKGARRAVMYRRLRSQRRDMIPAVTRRSP
jgi:hypothetical protein